MILCEFDIAFLQASSGYALLLGHWTLRHRVRAAKYTYSLQLLEYVELSQNHSHEISTSIPAFSVRAASNVK